MRASLLAAVDEREGRKNLVHLWSNNKVLIMRSQTAMLQLDGDAYNVEVHSTPIIRTGDALKLELHNEKNLTVGLFLLKDLSDGAVGGAGEKFPETHLWKV